MIRDIIQFPDKRRDGSERTVVAKGLAAFMIQHEIDHLDGKLILG